jgi:hypothetical protein
MILNQKETLLSFSYSLRKTLSLSSKKGRNPIKLGERCMSKSLTMEAK